MSENDDRCAALYRYKERLVRYVIGLGRSQLDAQDVVQIVIAETCRKIDSVPRGAELAYLLVAARNRAFNQARRTRVDDPLDPVHDTLADKARSPEAELIAREESALFRKRFNSVMAEFPPETQQILVLRGRGMTTDEIAATLAMHPTAVRSRLSRAAKQLRDRVGEPPQGLTWAELLGDDDDDQ